MSTSDEEESFSLQRHYREPPRKKRRRGRLDAEEQLQKIIENNVKKFIEQRYEDINIHV